MFAALPDADKNATLAFVEVLSGLVSHKSFPLYVRGLVEGSPRVVAGIAWALSSSRNYPANLLIEALTTPGVSKSALLEVMGAQKSRYGVRELLNAAYTQEPNEKAALFRIIAEIADFFIRFDQVDWALSAGVFDRQVKLSLRAGQLGGRAGEVVQTPRPWLHS